MIVSIKRSAPDISSKDSAGNGCEAASHNRVNLRQCELVEVGLDDERSGGLAQEYVGCGIQRLAGRGTLGNTSVTSLGGQWRSQRSQSRIKYQRRKFFKR